MYTGGENDHLISRDSRATVMASSLSECPRHNYNVLLKFSSLSSLLYSSDHPGNWSRISINMFALSDSSSSLTGIAIVLCHLISLAFTTGPRSC